MIKFEEDYLDKEERFWDYKTKPFDGKHPIDTTKIGISYYEDFLTPSGREYLEKKDNVKGVIKTITPKYYFEEVAKFFNSTVDRQKSQIAKDTATYEHLDQVIKEWKRTFPLPYLNYKNNEQEGRHRVYYIGQNFGWNYPIPCLIVTVADEERHQKEQEAEKAEQIEKRLKLFDEAIERCMLTEYNHVDDIVDDLRWYLTRGYNSVEEDELEIVPDYETNKIKIKTTDDVVAEAEYDISDLLLDEKEDDFLANFTLDDLE